MKNYFLFFAVISMATFFSCSKNTSDAYAKEVLVGKWILSKSCVCNSCTDTIPSDKNQEIIFSLNGKVELFGSPGNTEKHYSGTYSVTRQSYGEVLNINLDAADSDKNFLFIPGAIISSETGTTLVLDLNTPYMNPCLYQNTYKAVPN